MGRNAPHILVTTPESLYILLTAERSRKMLRSVRTLIVDEIHAVADDKRGSHLALSIAQARSSGQAARSEDRTVRDRQPDRRSRAIPEPQSPHCSSRPSARDGSGGRSSAR